MTTPEFPAAPLDSWLLARAADILVAHPFACWHYGDSIAFEGLLAASALLGDPSYAAFAHGFKRAWATRAEPYRELDHGWSRGQGWALLGLLDVLERLPGDHPATVPLRTSLCALARGLAATQESSGHWPALVHEADTFLETSAAPFVAAGVARGVRSGLLEADMGAVAERAYCAGLSALRDDGLVTGVSAAVWASTALGHYRAVPTGGAVAWGQGPLLLAAAELSGG